ncbi:MAG: DUF5671 domain-containing protein [archaeon]|nr:DUF5671 domain-containing protein [archaeon]
MSAFSALLAVFAALFLWVSIYWLHSAKQKLEKSYFSKMVKWFVYGLMFVAIIATINALENFQSMIQKEVLDDFANLLMLFSAFCFTRVGLYLNEINQSSDFMELVKEELQERIEHLFKEKDEKIRIEDE